MFEHRTMILGPRISDSELISYGAARPVSFASFHEVQLGIIAKAIFLGCTFMMPGCSLGAPMGYESSVLTMDNG